RFSRDWSSDVCSSDLPCALQFAALVHGTRSQGAIRIIRYILTIILIVREVVCRFGVAIRIICRARSCPLAHLIYQLLPQLPAWVKDLHDTVRFSVLNVVMIAKLSLRIVAMDLPRAFILDALQRSIIVVVFPDALLYTVVIILSFSDHDIVCRIEAPFAHTLIPVFVAQFHELFVFVIPTGYGIRKAP